MEEGETCQEYNLSYLMQHNNVSFTRTPTFAPCLALVLVAVLGLFGNLLACFVTSTKKFKQLSFSVYIQALAKADTLTLFLSAAPFFLEWLYENSARTVFGVAGYLSLHFISHTAQMASSWLIVAISVDRFIVVVHPLKRSQLCTRRRAAWTSFGILLTSACLIAAEILVAVLHETDACLQNFSELSEFSAMTKMRRLVVTLIVPGALALGLNIKVLHVIRKMRKFRKQLSEDRINHTRHKNGQEKITRALTILSALSAILFIPVIVLDIMDAVHMERHLQEDASTEAIVSRWCIAELIYITDISLHFYTLIGILYGYTLKCLTQASLLKSRFIGWKPNAPPINPTTCKCYNVQLETYNNNNNSPSASPRYQKRASTEMQQLSLSTLT
ncbi:lysophosphatidic acid receptor 6-like [Liolophura sinensis]|uniref:lysophosphatidic acid receptor 6-like n=1 Tax=Liolophura sinensis TaxID=3198878 RepID=UPI0031591093